MTENFGCIILGGGHAAAEAALCLRKEGFEGSILMAGDEPSLPYQRPPLSKTYLAEDVTADSLLIRESQAYVGANITVRVNARAVKLDAASRVVTFADGVQAQYGKLILATGARPRKLVGADHLKVHYIRTLADIDGLRAVIAPGKRALIIGGGYIGLEAAAMLKKLGLHVTVLEAMERILQRVTAAPLSEFYTRIHREEGVEILTGVSIKSLRADGAELADGRFVPADVLIAGIGVLPNIELAEMAGLRMEAGAVFVDSHCRTWDENIYAAGDCTSFFSPHYERLTRLESVQNANDQARVAAANIAGHVSVYDVLPWFWSDQYDLKLQIAGLSQGYDEVVLRGDSATGRSFAAFYFAQGRLIAVDAVNRPREFLLAKRLIAAKVSPDRNILQDETADLKKLL